MSSKKYPGVFIDHNRHTCIALSQTNGDVSFIPMTSAGFEIQKLDEAEFLKTFTQAEYPVPKAAQLYAQYASNFGGTVEAIQALASLTPMTKDEINMATQKKKAIPAKEAKAKATPAAKPAKEAKAKATPAAKPAKEAKAKATPAAKPAKETKAKDGKVSSAQRFRDLIVAGKLDDDAIFATVQKEYGLADDKRRYVGFYRFDCKRKGLIE
jgi:hypothetical protein